MSTSLPPISFEFFPPNTPVGVEKLRQVRKDFAAFNPEFYSVTYGAGGVTRDKTLSVVLEIAAEGLAVAPHLSCVGATREGIHELLALYRDAGIKRLVALRGDLPSGMVDAGDFRYASDLVAHVRETSADWFRIEVAAYPEVHPQARSAKADLDALCVKLDAGADRAITQFFYNADAFLALRDRLQQRGITKPLIPGIMPIHDVEKVSRFAANCGAEIPRWITQYAGDYRDDPVSQRAFLDDAVAAMCTRLVAEGVAGLHMYTLNRSDLTGNILRQLG